MAESGDKKKKRRRNYSSGTESEDSLEGVDPQQSSLMDAGLSEEEAEMQDSEVDSNDVEMTEGDEIAETAGDQVTEPDAVYKVVGEENFINLKKISITSKWISSGTTFAADLSGENLVELDAVGGLHPKLLNSVRTNIRKWFPVQHSVLPHLIAESIRPSLLPPRDLAISAPTGSGKTLCYILPILNSLAHTAAPSLHALVVAPVQNLVTQINAEFKRFDAFSTRMALLCGGGADFNSERRQLKGARLVIATPGRLIQHLVDPDSPFDLSHLRYLVIDEADRITQNARLEWLDTLEQAAHLGSVSSNLDGLLQASHLQKILVSATLSRDIDKLHVFRLRHPRLFRASAKSSEELKCPIVTPSDVDQIEDAALLPSSLSHAVIICEASMKPLALFTHIQNNPKCKKLLVFANNKMASQRLTILLREMSAGEYQVEELSANLFGRRRQKVLNRFKKGSTRVLIASDVLSRGIDVQDIDAVINYDKPTSERLFIHRVGRTARCGRPGTALSLTSAQERKDLETMLRKTGCWRDVSESTFKLDEGDSVLSKYTQALSALKDAVQKRGDKGNSSDQRVKTNGKPNDNRRQK